MKKVLIALLLISSYCYSEELFDYESFIEKYSFEKKEMADFFGKEMNAVEHTKSRNVQTDTFYTFSNAYGSWLVGIYGNGFVATCYSGPAIGRQEIYTNGILQSISDTFTSTGSITTHFHTGCKVVTTTTKQKIIYY